MPGFLSRYADTTTIFVDPPENDYWVKVRQHLRRGAFRVAQQTLIKPVMRFESTSGDDADEKGQKTETKGDVDSVGYQNELVFQAIVDWNLTDEDGNPLPLSPDDAKRRSIDLLPEEVFEQIVAVVQKAAPKKGAGTGDAEATFPTPSVVGSDGEVGDSAA